MKTVFEFENIEIEIEFDKISENDAIDCALANLETALDSNEFDTSNLAEILNTVDESFTIKFVSYRNI